MFYDVLILERTNYDPNKLGSSCHVQLVFQATNVSGGMQQINGCNSSEPKKSSLRRIRNLLKTRTREWLKDVKGC